MMLYDVIKFRDAIKLCDIINLGYVTKLCDVIKLCDLVKLYDVIINLLTPVMEMEVIKKFKTKTLNVLETNLI